MRTIKSGSHLFTHLRPRKSHCNVAPPGGPSALYNFPLFLPPNFEQEAARLTLLSSLIPKLCRAFHYQTKHFFMFIGQSHLLMKCFFISFAHFFFFFNVGAFSFDRKKYFIYSGYLCAEGHMNYNIFSNSSFLFF